MKYQFTVLIEKDEDGFYVAEVEVVKVVEGWDGKQLERFGSMAKGS